MFSKRQSNILSLSVKNILDNDQLIYQPVFKSNQYVQNQLLKKQLILPSISKDSLDNHIQDNQARPIENQPSKFSRRRSQMDSMVMMPSVPENVPPIESPLKKRIERRKSQMTEIEQIEQPSSQSPQKTTRIRLHRFTRSMMGNDIDDFFTIQPSLSLIPLPDSEVIGVVKKEKNQKSLKNQYELINFTDYVENVYGVGWFEQEVQIKRSPKKYLITFTDYVEDRLGKGWFEDDITNFFNQ